MVGTLEKILITRFSSVGDIVLSSLLVRVMRQQFPQSAIDYLVKDEFADLVQENPHITQVIRFPKNGTFADLADLRRRITATKYDLIVDIHDSLRSRYLSFGAPRVVRVNKRKIPRFLLIQFKWNLYNFFGGAPSVAQRYVETVQHFGVSDDGNGLELFLAADGRQSADKLLRLAGCDHTQTLIGVCPSAKHANKMWLPERFAQAACELSRDPGAGIVLFGSGDEELARCRDIELQIQHVTPRPLVLNLAGKISLTETAAIMDQCALILTNDSGLMHIAAARKRKIVAIFGPTVRELGFFPFGTPHAVIEHPSLNCRPCTHIGLPVCPKGHFKCMKEIPVSLVVDSARHLLEH